MKPVFIAASVALSLLATTATAEDDAFVTYKSLTLEVATELAQAALDQCRSEGYQIGVAVVDRSGTLQVFLRDRFAGPHVVETATRKAWTAASFRTDTLALDVNTGPDGISSGIRSISQALPLGGGVPVEAAGSIVGAIGISGAPSPAIDDACARAGIEAIIEKIAF